MKHLFFVSVAVGIFAGASLNSTAQSSINMEKMSVGGPIRTSSRFIEGIEINRDANAASVEKISMTPVRSIAVSTKKTAATTSMAIETCSSMQFKFAQLMDVDVETITNFTLYNFIEEWWATRYRYGGTSKAGIDCSAYTGELISNTLNIRLPRTARDQYAACEKIQRDDLQEGDLVFFNTQGGVSHVGVYLGNNYFTHSSVHNGVTISSLNEDYYSRKFISGGRVKTDEVVIK